MLKSLFNIIKLLVLIFVIWFLINNNGSITVQWQDWELSTNIVVISLLILILLWLAYMFGKGSSVWRIMDIRKENSRLRGARQKVMDLLLDVRFYQLTKQHRKTQNTLIKIQGLLDNNHPLLSALHLDNSSSHDEYSTEDIHKYLHTLSSNSDISFIYRLRYQSLSDSEKLSLLQKIAKLLPGSEEITVLRMEASLQRDDVTQTFKIITTYLKSAVKQDYIPSSFVILLQDKVNELLQQQQYKTLLAVTSNSLKLDLNTTDEFFMLYAHTRCLLALEEKANAENMMVARWKKQPCRRYIRLVNIIADDSANALLLAKKLLKLQPQHYESLFVYAYFSIINYNQEKSSQLLAQLAQLNTDTTQLAILHSLHNVASKQSDVLSLQEWQPLIESHTL